MTLVTENHLARLIGQDDGNSLASFFVRNRKQVSFPIGYKSMISHQLLGLSQRI